MCKESSFINHKLPTLNFLPLWQYFLTRICHSISFHLYIELITYLINKCNMMSTIHLFFQNSYCWFKTIRCISKNTKLVKPSSLFLILIYYSKNFNLVLLIKTLKLAIFPLGHQCKLIVYKITFH